MRMNTVDMYTLGMDVVSKGIVGMDTVVLHTAAISGYSQVSQIGWAA